MSDTVTVLMDGKPLVVPKRVGSWAAVRDALGVPPGVGVAIKSLFSMEEDESLTEAIGEVEGWALLGVDEADTPGEVPRSWDFGEGDEYETVEFGEFVDDEPTAPWQSDPDNWKDG